MSDDDSQSSGSGIGDTFDHEKVKDRASALWNMVKIAPRESLIHNEMLSVNEQTHLDTTTSMSIVPEPEPTPSPAPPSQQSIMPVIGFSESDGSDDEENDLYTITWKEGELGLLFKQEHGHTVIRRVNRRISTEGLHVARKGDILVALNGQQVSTMTYDRIVAQLRQPKFPMTLDFERVTPGSHYPPAQLKSLPSSISDQSSTQLPQQYSASPPPVVTPLSSGDRMQPQSSSISTPRLNSTSIHGSQSFEDTMSSDIEYDVLWDAGRLGCGLREKNQLPYVKSVSLTDDMCESVKQQIRAGDYLVAINGCSTQAIGFQRSVMMLKHEPKPVALRFRGPPREIETLSAPPENMNGDLNANASSDQSSPQSGSKQVRNSTSFRESADESNSNVEEDVPLGERQYVVHWTDGPLGFSINRAADRSIVVFSKNSSGAGLANLVNTGDQVISVAGKAVSNMDLVKVRELIESIQKPVVMVFQQADLRATPPVPSIRELREKEKRERAAKAAALAANGSSGRMSSSDSFDQKLSGVEREDQERPAAISVDNGNHDQIVRRDTEERSEGISNARSSDQHRAPTFEELEQGKVKTIDIMDLPPPPSYSDLYGSPESKDLSNGVSGNTLVAGSNDQSQQPFQHVQSGQAIGNYSPHAQQPQHIPLHSAPGLAGMTQEEANLEMQRQRFIQIDKMRNRSPPQAPPTLPIVNDLNEQDTNYTTASDIAPGIGGIQLRPRDAREMRNGRGRGLPNGQNMPHPLPTGMVGPNTITPMHRSVSGRVRPTPPANLNELWIRWSEGSLGIRFKTTRDGKMVVTRLTGNGRSPGLEKLQAGDWLVTFGQYFTRDYALNDVLEMIKRMPKPVDLCFVVN